MAALKDLELMIQSRYPLIAIATVEEDRLEKALEDIADDLKVPFWLWSVTGGLKRRGHLNSVYDTQEPLKALNNIAAMPGEGLYLLKDIHRFLDKPDIVRKLQDLGPGFAMDRRVLALYTAHAELPPALQSIAAAYTLELPSVEELKALATRVLKTLSREQPVKVELTPEDFGRLVERLKGFTAFEAERAMTKAIMADHALTKADFELIIDLKKQLLQKDGVLEYIAPEENLAEVGGFKNLKAWLAKRTKAFAPEAKQFGISSPKGVLLLGVQGCLRGDTRVLLADGRMPTLEALARQVSDCLEPGEYDVAHRVALEDGTSALATKLQVHSDRETLLIKFGHGRELEATPDHELLTPTGWRRADRLTSGDEVVLWRRNGDFVTPAKRTEFGRPLHSVRVRKAPVDTLPDLWTPELAGLIGLIAAEGCRDRYRVTLTLAEDEYELAAWLRQHAEKLFGVLPNERWRLPKRVREFRFDSFDIAVNLHPLIQGTQRTKTVPDVIFSLDDACVAGFLRALFEGDGTVANADRAVASARSPRVALKTVSIDMARSTQLLLQRLGIHSAVYTQVQIHGYSRYPSHTVNVAGRKSLERFAAVVGFITERKNSKLARGLASYRRYVTPRHEAAARITAIEIHRVQERVYDLTVPGAERFIANGLVVHNCGKTLVARAIAREWGLPLLKMETGRLYDKYIGESEKNLEKALKTAEHMAPCVLMIDELEKALSYGGGGDGDAGLSKRVFGRILGWLQDRTAPVFVVATCNDITALPPELTRKGRFDEIFFIDLPSREERQEIFAVHLTKRKRNAKLFDLPALAAASEGFSGAEIEQAVVAALLTAFSRGGELTSAIIAEELRATKPLSVTRREDIDRLRAWAADRTVSAS